MKCAVGLCGHCQFGPLFVCKDGPVFRYDRDRGTASACGRSEMAARPKLAVWKFASCDGCQLSLLDCEDELLAVAGAVEIANFLEASRAVAEGPVRPRRWSRARSPRRTTPSASSRSARSSQLPGHHRRLRHRRRHPGAAQLRRRATSSSRAVYATPRVHQHARRPRRRSPTTCSSISSCAAARSTSSSCSRCSAPSCTAASRTSRRYSVCIECKRRGTVCVMVAHGTPCLGPVTQAGCGALCPSYDRGCYGCFGPMETPNTASLGALVAASLGAEPPRPGARLPHLQRLRRTLPHRERRP